MIFNALSHKKNVVFQKLLEKPNSKKMEFLITRKKFDLATKYAKNQECEGTVVAEICKLHGDHLYTKVHTHTHTHIYIYIYIYTYRVYMKRLSSNTKRQ